MDEAEIKRDFMVVCQCKAVRYKTIRLAMAHGADTLEKIRKLTGANTGCGKNCTEHLNEILKKHREAKGS